MLDRAHGFLARERVVQRIGVGVMTVFVLLAAAGLFGQGVLCSRETNAGAQSVRYERFSRLMLCSTIDVSARTGAPNGTTARIAFDRCGGVLAAAREHHGLESLKDIKFAIVERHGGISIVPTDDAR